MTNPYDLSIKKPIKIWNRELSISPKSFFSSLGKAAISGVVMDGKGVADNLLDLIKDITPDDRPPYAAWILVYKSLLQTLTELIKDYEEFFRAEVNEVELQRLADELDTALSEIEVGFDARFFDHPQNLPLLEEIKPPLMQWLMALGMSEAEANALHLRLKQRFVLVLHQQWLKDPHEYACIEEAVSSPFVKASNIQRDWMQYRAWLQEQANERMFAEAFSLSQVFVPLRAYYNEKSVQSGEHVDGIRQDTYTERRVVVDLHSEMEAWVRSFDAEHAVRIISGGPGSGKSSFGKMFAAFVAREIEEVPVIFVPLHHFDPSDDLISAMEQFVKQERYLSGSPLHGSEGEDRLLIIFDGLDELSMQGKAASETAQSFVEEVINKIDRFNAQNLERQVLIAGRDMAIQSVSGRLRGQQQVLHVLPYFVSESEDYVDTQKLLAEDQRHRWWNKYGAAKGLAYEGLPEELSIDRLMPITKEPLLNYLVALSYERKEIEFTQNTTLNTIYADLLHAVHDRQWDHGRHDGAKHLEIDEFIRVLEEIALAVWHGDGRTATINQIFERCQNSNLTRYLEAFQEGAKKGVTRLLTAFYFRQSEQRHAGEKTFEFTHKSFGEYLIARRIVRSVKQICSELQRHDDDPDSGFDERDALKRWAELCGPSTMDDYVFKFVCDEVAAYPEELDQWQQTYARLLGYAARIGVPMELLDIRSFKEMMRQSRNAEESLMVIHYACAVKTRRVSAINWGDEETAFGEWMKRLQGQRDSLGNRLVMGCLIFLNLREHTLYISDFYDANFNGSNLREANIWGTTFRESSFVEVRLERVFLKGANLEGANLEGANLEGANLEGANLEGANLEGANLEGAHLQRANLEGANLEGANLEGANPEGANLEGAHLQRANLEGANLEGANLEGANLEGAHLQRANLEGANLEGANLERANLEGVLGLELPKELNPCFEFAAQTRRKTSVSH